MRTKRTSFAVMAALVAAALALSACGGGAPPPQATATSPGVSPTASVSPTPTATSSPTVDATEIEIEVEDGQVKGPQEVSVTAGERIVLTVQADVTDEVHVHGYDRLAQVSPGNPATIRFRADLVGVYEVELESAGKLLFRLKVNP
jgi:FtsP/CotA-like multicopper oxidase with cupredoxin domain